MSECRHFWSVPIKDGEQECLFCGAKKPSGEWGGLEPLKTLPEEDFVISEDDMAICLGSGELKPCPFCGGHAICCGTRNQNTEIIGYSVMCTNQTKCMAMVHANDYVAEKARARAVERWNRRVS